MELDRSCALCTLATKLVQAGFLSLTDFADRDLALDAIANNDEGLTK